MRIKIIMFIFFLLLFQIVLSNLNEEMMVPKITSLIYNKNSVKLEWKYEKKEDVLEYHVFRLDEEGIKTKKSFVTKNNFIIDESIEDNRLFYHYYVQAVTVNQTKPNISNIESFYFNELNFYIKSINSAFYKPYKPSEIEMITVFYKDTMKKINNMELFINNREFDIEKIVDMKYEDSINCWVAITELLNVNEISFIVDGKMSPQEKLYTSYSGSKKNIPKPINDIIYSDEYNHNLRKVELILEWNRPVDDTIIGYEINNNNKKTRHYRHFKTEYREEIKTLEREMEFDFTIYSINKLGKRSEKYTEFYRRIEGCTVFELLYLASLSNPVPLRLIASLEKEEEWTLKLFNENQKLIFLESGKGDYVIVKWNLKDLTGSLIEVGNYYYYVENENGDLISEQIPIQIIK